MTPRTRPSAIAGWQRGALHGKAGLPERWVTGLMRVTWGEWDDGQIPETGARIQEGVVGFVARAEL